MKKLIIILITGLMTICGYAQTIVCDSTENIKLKQQVEEVMKYNEVITGERDLLYNNYRASEKTSNIKLKAQSKLTTGLLIGGSVYIAITIPIFIYFVLQ